MAVRTSATSGDYGTGATWVGGVAPVEGDSVVIARTGTALETFSTDAAGYAIGATAITLTGAVAAGSYVIGEAVQFGSTDPNYYTITNWNSGTKVLTVTALIVAIPAVATLVKSRGHVVTVAGTYIAGDDTTSAFTINGTLRASRVANSSLTVKGTVKVSGSLVATIDYGRLSLNDVIPAAYTARLIINYSAAMASNKYGVEIASTTNAFFCGATKTTNALLTSTINAGGTSCTVDDATGWAVNDYVVLPATDGTYTHYERVQIATITPGTGTTATITFAATSYAHASGGDIGNLTKNVVIKNYNTSTWTYFSMAHASTASDNKRELSNVEFYYVGSSTGAPATQAFIYGAGSYCTPLLYFQDCTFNNCAGAGPTLFLYQYITTHIATNLLFYNGGGYTNGQWYTAQGTTAGLSNSVFHGSGSVGVNTGYSQGGQGCVFTNLRFYIGTGFSSSGGNKMIFNSCKFHSTSSHHILNQTGFLEFNSCSFSSSDLPGTPAMVYVTNGNSVTIAGQVSSSVFTDCEFGTPSGAFSTNFANANPESEVIVINKNASITAQEIHLKNGSFYRDNSVYNRSLSSVRAETETSSEFSKSFTFLAESGVTYKIIGYLRKNSTYGASTLPHVTVSGLGITPVTFTMTNSVDTWEKFTLSFSQSTGATGNLTFTFYAQSATTTGKAYLDGVVQSPFVDTARHYGYIFDSTSPKQTVDSVISQSDEATVGAYTGISIAGSTITLSSNHTIRELYDYCKYYLCQTANLSVTDFFTSTDGVNFTSTYNLTLNGGNITGTGNINLGAMTFTRTGSETSTCPITYNSSAAVFGNISVSGLVANSRVRLNNTTDNSQLYNAVVAGTSVTIPATWTADKALDLRVTNVSGVTAYLPYETTGTLTSSLASFTVSQSLDTIYNANAIDGSAVTYFSTDYPNIQVDISSGTTFTVQQLYAWFQYNIHSVNGIVFYFGGMTAQDSVNYLINSSAVNLLLDNTSGHNITMTGGYLQRSDLASYIYGSTANSIIPIYDRAYIPDSTQIRANTSLIPALL